MNTYQDQVRLDDYIRGFSVGYSRAKKTKAPGSHYCDCFTCTWDLKQETDEAAAQERKRIERAIEEYEAKIDDAEEEGREVTLRKFEELL